MELFFIFGWYVLQEFSPVDFFIIQWTKRKEPRTLACINIRTSFHVSYLISVVIFIQNTVSHRQQHRIKSKKKRFTCYEKHSTKWDAVPFRLISFLCHNKNTIGELEETSSEFLKEQNYVTNNERTDRVVSSTHWIQCVRCRGLAVLGDQ